MANQQFELFKARLDSVESLGEDNAPLPVMKLKPNISEAWLSGVRTRLQNSFQ